jgi:hypothetical protein
MDLENLTIKQARELAAMFGGSAVERHPLVGTKVLAILPGRFIYIGTLEQHGGHYCLPDAQNLRFWKERNGGLGEFARKGPVSGDKVDNCPPVWFRASEEIAFMECRYGD